MNIVNVDARGEQCPVPVIKAKRALQENPQAREVRVRVSEENAAQNVQRMAQSRGFRAEIISEDQGLLVAIALQTEGTSQNVVADGGVADGGVTDGVASNGVASNGDAADGGASNGVASNGVATVAAPSVIATPSEVAAIPAVATGPIVVAIGSDTMGDGNAQLGQILMKGFIYALARLEDLPACVLFFNGGAAFTCKDSPVLADIELMAEQGVEILTCGTCLDFLGIKEKLAVGQVTNMYDIVDRLMGAGKVVKP